VEINRFILEKSIKTGNAEIVPVAQIRAIVKKTGGSIMAAGSKKIIGIVVVYPEKKCAYAVTGEEIPLKKFIEQVPDIKELLDKIV